MRGMRPKTATHHQQNLLKKIRKHRLGFGPILLVDAVFDGGRRDGALYQPRFLECFEVLGNGGVGDGQLLGDVASKAGAPLFEKPQNEHPHRVPMALAYMASFASVVV